MRVSVMVLNETYKTGKGRASGKPYEMLTIRVADKSLPKETRCKTILEITLAAEDVTYRNQLEDQILEVDILEMRGEFGGCTQASGRIVREASSIA